jgi:glycosyltransferase involved in cell wall biosynthesis
MNVAMFSSWEVRCGIAQYTSDLVGGLRMLDDTRVTIVPFDRQDHPRADYMAWGRRMNAGDVAHIQHEYTFFKYLAPWQNRYPAFVSRIRKPLVITRHVSLDGPLTLPGNGWWPAVRRLKWALYNRWLGPYATYLNKGTFDCAQHIVVLSGRLKDQLVARGVRADKISIIPAGVPEVPKATGGERLRREWGWEGKRVLGVFGFITPAKGHAVALEALARLPDDHVLLVAGGLRRESDRPALEAIVRASRSAGLEGRVRITGYVEETDMPAHIDACDALVFPATHADASYSVVTGLAYQAAPVIASDLYGHRELSEQGAGMALFRSGDAADLARTVGEVLGSAERRAAMREAAARYARDHAWPANAAKTRAVYAGLLDGAGSAA